MSNDSRTRLLDLFAPPSYNGREQLVGGRGGNPSDCAQRLAEHALHSCRVARDEDFRNDRIERDCLERLGHSAE